ncbi:FAD-dependent oxidoreductase [Nonomuraea sp. NPDC001831]|uniref:FAD-dependent oxidoreductase n=1 Tax=Nonomuraea sp. NPDC001831 TaxID=3364340 RepID=UPI0036A49B90
MPDYDVLICGAGAGGLTLAHFLGRQGHRVLLADKQSRPRSAHKGELVQPRTVQILEAAGLVEPLAERGARTVRRLSCHTPRGDELIDLDFRLLDKPYDYGLLHYYKDFRDVLGGRLGSTVDYWQGASVRELRRDRHGRVAGAYLGTAGRVTEVAATLTVACDGRESRLRNAAGIEPRIRRYPHQLVGLDLPDAPELGEDMAMYLTPGGLRVLFQMPGGRARLYVQIPAGRFRSIGRRHLGAWADDLLREVPALRRVAGPLRAGLDSVQVLPAWRFVAPTWQVPGLALLGDAAHGVHPMVGQGMNAAIGDAWCLAGELEAVRDLSATAVDEAMGRYEAARRPVLGYVSRLSHTLALLFTSTSATVRLARPLLLSRNSGNDVLRRRIVAGMAGFTSDLFTGWAIRSALGLTRR